MTSNPLQFQKNSVEVCVYECEVHLKFRILEEGGLMSDLNGDKEQLLQILLEAFMTGNDEYLETQLQNVKVRQVEDVKASPEMRRRLMRLRNSPDRL